MDSRRTRPWRTSVLLGLAAAVALVATVAAAGDTRFSENASALDRASAFTASPLEGSEKAAQPAPTVDGLASVIVKLDVEPLAAYDGGIAGLPATSPAATGDEKLDASSPASQKYLDYLAAKRRSFETRAEQTVPASRVTGRFDVVLGGVSMLVPENKIETIDKLAGVVSVERDELYQLETEVSPQFIGARSLWKDLGGQGSAGEGVIVGVLDSGVWPEHASYSDPDPLGKPYGAPPPPVSGTRQCEFTGGANPGTPFTCNNKLIGADRFMATYDAVIGLLPTEYTTARDDNGHGTHTSSTAAGNRGVAADIFDIPRGTVSGVAPRAHVIAYKICGDQGCFGSDAVAGINKSIQDGVDVLNYSISGGNNPYGDSVALAFRNAYAAGVFVAASAGNAGPTPDTVNHRGPWITSVGASTSDRHFLSDLTVAAGGDSLALTGATVTGGISAATPVVNAADAPFNDPQCLDNAVDGAFAGKIVVCQRGGPVAPANARILKSFRVKNRGGVGMVLYNPTLQGLNTDNHYVPSVHLENDAGAQLLAFLESHAGETATFTAGTPREVPGDVMAPFSSRGGPGQSLGVSKPDITAPGVQILAGNTPTPATPLGGPAGELFQAIQGTSMSSPHVAGSAALVADRRPTWTPGQVKSALMTTAKQGVENADGSPTTPFDDGSGRVDLRRAADAGVTFDVPVSDYVAYASKQDLLYQLNYPSVYIPSMPGEVTIQRTAENVTNGEVEYDLDVDSPKDLDISVPDEIQIDQGASETFDIAIDARNVPIGQVRHAALELDGKDTPDLIIPITIVRKQAPVTLTKTCDPLTFNRGATTSCSITMQNTTFSDATVNMSDQLPGQLKLVPGSVVGGTATNNTVSFSGTLAAAQPPDVTIAPGDSPAGGYLPLSLFGIPPVSGVGDDTITNFNVPPFTYAGETWSSVGFSSNGYVVVGGGSGPDNSLNNQNFPNPARPNNTLALFWTDLNPAAAGALRIGTLTDGTDTWLVMDWEGVREFSTAGNLHSFQVWIGINGDANPGQDISYAYGANTGNGDLGLASVGAENRFGNRGGNTYFNGTGTLPTNGTQLRVTAGAPIPGETKVVTFDASGDRRGSWQNCAEMTSNLFFGTSTSCVSGRVR